MRETGFKVQRFNGSRFPPQDGFALLVSALFATATVSFAVTPAPTSGAQPGASSQKPESSIPKPASSIVHPESSVAPSSTDVERAEGVSADLIFRAGQYNKALPLFQQQLVAAGDDAEAGGKALFHIGQCLTGLHRYAEAVTAFDTLLTKFPSSSFADDALMRKGAVQAGFLKKPAAGVVTWQQLIQKYPRSELVPEARFLIGLMQWIDGQKAVAKETWKVLVRDFPQDPHSVQAKLYMEAKQL